jgi:hypothetical protein
MLIKDPNERTQRTEEKRRLVLRFLRSETWSTSDVLGLVMGVKTRQGIHNTLMKLERDNMIRRHLMPVGTGRGLTLWGITPHGQAFAWDEDEEMQDFPVFEPSRIALSSIPHHLDIQMARIKAESAGWTNWVTCDRGVFFKQVPAEHRPDALMTRPDGVVIAIEVERTIKTRKRYQQVLAGHLKAMAAKHWAQVYYITPPELTPRLKRVINSIPSVTVNGSHVALDQQKHLSRFHFISLTNWPNEEN